MNWKRPFFVAFGAIVFVWLLWRPGTEPVGQDSTRAAVSQPVPSKPLVKLSAPVKVFREWFEEYSAAPTTEALELGKAYAKEHTKEIARLIKADPQLAIESAVPMVMRQNMPKEILALLEDRVRVRADYEVFGNVPLEGQEATTEPYKRTVTGKDGQRWNAHVYGWRLSQRSRLDSSLNGVAVGREMAVSDSPLRVLEVGEVPQDDGREVVQVCPISGIETEVEKTPDGTLTAVSEQTPAFETPERVIYVCSGGHITQIAEQYLANEEEQHWATLGTDLFAGTGSGPAHAPISGTIPGGWTLGNRTFLYIRACFPDNPVDPQNEQECYDMFKQANDYIVQNSYGRCYLTYAFPPLVVLPYPLEWYSKYDTDVGGGDYLIQNHAIQIAKSMGYNNGSYNMWAVRWNNGPGAYGGSASVGGAGMRMKSSGVTTFLHELGHNLGVWHANRWQTSPPSFIGPGTNHEYGNYFDIMGSGGTSVNGHYTASFKNTLSWMPQEQFWNVTSSGVYRIHQVDASIADPSLRYAMRIKKDAERDYWAEYRQRWTGIDSFMNGAMMTWDMWGIGNIGGSGGSPYNGSNKGAHLLDMTPGSFGNGVTDTRNDAGLYVGRTYSDPESNIHVTPIAKNATTPPSLDMQVQIGSVAGNTAPTLSVSASTATPAVGANVTLTATASDANGDTIAYAWVFGDGTYSSNNSASQTKSWSTAGHYQVLCTASDMKGKRTTKAIFITVGSPTTFFVSGNITGPDSLPLEGVYVANYAMSITTSHANSATFKGTWTDSDGNYVLTGLAAGSYTITPNLYPFTFTGSGAVTVGPSVAGKNFTSTTLPLLTISYPDSTAAEGAVPDTATIRVTREGSTAADLIFQIYNVNTGSATRTTDYTLSPAPTAATNDTGSGTSQYTIPAGASFIDITVTPVNDSTAEGVEVASLDFANTAAGYYMAGDARAQVSITDDENSLPVVRLTPVDDSGNEAGTDTLTMKLVRNVVTASALTVNLSYSGTATRGTDYNSSLSVSIPADSASTTFTITPINDTEIETTETITCTVSTNAAYNRDSTAQAVTSILNDDDMPVVSIVATDAAAAETGNDKGLFTISRTGSTAASLIVDYGVNGRAVLGTDYRRLEGRATIPAGFASTTVEIVPFDDAVDEGTQDVILQLRTSQNYFISSSAQTATVTITDNDASEVYIELNTGNGTEPASGSASGPVFQITRPASGTAITVNYTISGTATSGVDFTALPGSIAFAAADTNKTITVSMLADTAFEDAESITMTIVSGTGYSPLVGQNQSATGWIFDGDQPTVEVNAADSTSGLTVPFSETTSAGEDFLISRRVATASDLIVNYTMSGTATSGADFTALSGTATILANTTSVYVTVVPINDTTPEGVETVTMNITPAPGTYGVRVGSATMLLGDNDSFSSGSLAFGAASASTAEDVGTYNVPVNVTGTPPGDLTVQYRVNGGSAAGNGIDFTLAEGVLTFASGETSKFIPITIVADQLPEPAETIVVQLLNVVGGNLGTSSFTLTINNRSLPEAFTDPASAVLANGATLNGRVNPGGLATDYWFEYGSTTAYGSTTSVQSIAASNTLTAVNLAFTGGTPTTQFRLVAQNASGTSYGINQTFVVSNAPSVSTDPATNVLVTTATLNGTGNSNGVTGTAWFEWGLTNAYGNTTSPVQNLAATTNNVPLTFTLSGLTQATTYFYRAVLQSTVGTVYGAESSFTTGTPLVVRTGSFTGAGQTGIVCDGYVNPGGVSTDWWFEYGTDTSYGSQTTSQTISGSSTQLVRFTLNDLTASTEYHFRLVAQNPATTSYGDDQTITTLDVAPNALVEPAFTFTGIGTAPQAPLILAPDGTFWGTTSTGGSYNRGTTFRMSAGGTLTTLANFYGNTNNSDSGNGPNGNLTRAGDGNFYGTTNTGGTSNVGTIFRMTPAGEVTTLVSFTGTSGPYLGSNPINGLTLGNDGALYGVAQNSNSGYIFKITTGGVYTQLVAFTGTTGAFLGSAPRGNLVLGSDGNFYGTTAAGGTGGGFGTVFKMTPAGVLTTLVNFTGTTGAALGATPTGGLVEHSNGNFYGMTNAGGTSGLGTIFEVTPAGVLTTLVNFTGGSGLWLGSAPKGSLTLAPDGFLYGTTTTGGTLGGFGTIFKVSTTGTLTTLVQFSGTSGVALGSSPNGGLVLHPSGDFYGTTSAGGALSSGTLFKMSSDGTLTTLLSCTPFPAFGKLVQASNGKLYGVTNNGGGSTNTGMAFSMPKGGAPDILTLLTPVSGTTAWDARAGFIQAADGNLYGTAATGAGSNTNGGVFKLTTAGVLTNVFSFSGTTGSNLGSVPRAQLIVGNDGQLWGTTSTGGTGGGFGVLYKTTLAGTQTTLVNLTGTTGANLGASSNSPLLFASDGSYYGATTTGGTSGLGTIFKLTSGGTHTVLYHSTSASGSSPTGSLVRGADGILYGVTSGGGAYNLGTVFRCTTGGVFTSLASFSGTTGVLAGQTPNGGLVIGPDGHYYGVTSAGGIYSAGTVFRVNRDGSVQSMYSLTGREDGITSANGLAVASTGELYGVSNSSVFRVNLPAVPLALAATSVTATSATLNGSVDANGESGSFWFEVNGIARPAQSFTASANTQNFVASLTGLAPLQTYRYKAFTTASSGTFSSVEKTFTTLSTVNFASANDVPVTSIEYTASGTPAITLGFVPVAGTVLKLVNNTGFLPVSGAYTNLPEGGLVTALNGGTPYTFEISYMGGDGNDITLTAVSEVITFPPIPLKYVGDAAFNLTATSSGASAVVYQIVAGGTSASVSGNTVTLTSTPGTVTVKATAGTALPKYQTFVLSAAANGFTSISASKQVEWSLGIRANGTLWAWGTNTYGNLGDASTTQRRSPVQAGTATNWRQVSVGTDHAVGTRTDGTLWAWGRNNNGQAGQGSLTTTQFTSPTQIGTATDWAWVVAGANHCVAVKTDGTLWAWGLNSSGQIGQGATSTTPTLAPTQIGTGATWAQTGASLHAGGDFTLALQTNGTLWAWGANASGQLGDASTSTRSVPVQIGGVTTWNRVVAGTAFSGATRTDGTLWVWGSNASGQLGDGSLVNRTAPVQLGTDTNWSRLAAGNAFFIATKTNGTLWSWGFNGVGQLGQGTSEINSIGNTPKQIGTATNWQDASGGSNYAIAITTDGGLKAWGSSTNSQLGWLPRLPLPLYPQLGPVIAVSGGGSNFTAFIRPDGSLWTLGSNGSGQLGIGVADGAHYPIAMPIGIGQTWRRISAGHSYLMAIRSDGSLWATGLNSSGQIGDGTTTNRTSLTRIGTDTDWVSVCASSVSGGSPAHTLAVKANGTLWAWGNNASGQLGDGTLVNRLSPVQIGTDTSWSTVFSTGGSHSLALKRDGTLWSWGLNSNGQVGNNTTVNVTAPVQVLANVKTAAGGSAHSHAILNTGTLWGWGLNTSGQLGDATTTQRTLPVQIGTATNWNSINSTNGTTSNGTRADGSLWVWGPGAFGQFGNGTFGTANRTSPAQVGTGAAWSTVNSIGGHQLAQTADGSLWGWGFSNGGPTAFAGHDQWDPDQILPALSAAQTITFTAPATVSIGSTITLAATASSGLPARYIVTGNASLNGDKLTVNGTGFISVIAYQPGDSYWQSSDIKHAYINLAAPTATTLAATSVTATSATLNATVNPNGAPTTVQFQSGTTVSYGTNTLVTLANASGTTAENVSVNLTGLTPGTTYNYRIHTSSLGGTVPGVNMTFATPSNIATLSNLTISAGTLSPVFASNTLNYSASVPVSTASLNLTATASNANATLKLRNNGAAWSTITSAVAVSVSLETGLNNVQVESTAQDGTTVRLYSIQITRAASFAQWSASTGITGTTNVGPLEDFDGDGIPNVLEYAFGMLGSSGGSTGALVIDGATLNATGQPISKQLPPPGGGAPEWCALFIRRKDYVQAGLTYTPSFSADLGTWEASADTPTVLADDGIYQAVCLPYPDVNGQPAKFFRLQVNMAP